MFYRGGQLTWPPWPYSEKKLDPLPFDIPLGRAHSKEWLMELKLVGRRGEGNVGRNKKVGRNSKVGRNRKLVRLFFFSNVS